MPATIPIPPAGIKNFASLRGLKPLGLRLSDLFNDSIREKWPIMRLRAAWLRAVDPVLERRDGFAAAPYADFNLSVWPTGGQHRTDNFFLGGRKSLPSFSRNHLCHP